MGAQSVRQAVGVNGGPTVTFPATVAGNLNIVIAFPGHYTTVSNLSVTDSKGQAYKLDGTCGTPDSGAYACVFYVCSGVGGVTSAIVNGTDGIQAVDFLEGVGTISSNCAGAVSTAAATTAPSLISLTPDQPNELAVAGFACAGEGLSVNGNVTYGHQLDYGGNPAAAAITTSMATITAETDSGNSKCNATSKSGWNGVFASFRTQQPSSGGCPTFAAVPSIAGCSYNQNLGSQAVGSTSSSQVLSASIAAGTTVGSIGVLSTGITGKDFANAAGSTCTASTYSAATNCVVNLSFVPQATGLRRGAVVFYSGTNNTGTVLAMIPIYGIGTGAQVAYRLGGTQTNVGSGYSSPDGVAVDVAANVFVADAIAQLIDKVTPTGTQSTIGGGFSKPAGVAVDGAGNVYVADSNAPAVYQIAQGGTQAKVGSGFVEPVSVAVDGAGNVYVADPGLPAIYEITPSGSQTKMGSGFIQPSSVAVDGAGNVYVADPGVPAVYKITSGGTQTTVGSGFSKPSEVAVDAAGSVYVFDQNDSTVYEVTTGGTQSSVIIGFGNQAGFAMDGSGNLYVADTGNARVVKIDRADAPSLSFTTTQVGSTSSDSPKTVQVQNIGNQALTFSALTYPMDFPEATGDSNACASTTALTPGGQCDLPIYFTPKSAANLSEDVTVTDNALNIAGAIQTIAVGGIGTSGGTTQAITFTPPLSPVIYGVGPIALSAAGGASGNPVVFSILSGPGSVSGNTLTITSAGVVVIAANQAGNSTYSPAPQVTQSVVVNQVVQTITFTPPPSPVTFGSTIQSTPVFTLVQKCHPTSNTTNTCTFPNNVTPGNLVIGGAIIDNTIASTGVKDGAGHAFTLTPNSPCTGGPVTSHAWLFYLLSSPGGASTNTVLFMDTNADYVDELWAYEFSVSGGTPAFDTDTNGCGISSSNADPVATLTLAGSNELAYFASYITGGGATGVGSPWTLGSLTQLHNADGYDTNASSSITTAITPPGHGWGILMAMAVKAIPAGAITLSATGGASGNSVVFSVVSGPGSISGSVLTITGAGTIVIAANEAGNANYAPAPQVTQSVVVNPASQTINFTPPASPVTYGVSPFTLSATGGASGNPIVFNVVSGPGSTSDNILTITGTGTVVVAANQAGNANYAAAPQVTQSIVVNQPSQTINFTAPASPVTYGVAPITLSATGGGSGNPVVFSIVSGLGSINGNALTVTGVGTVVVAANQAGNANYTAAPQVTQSIVVNQASQTINFTALASPVTYGVAPITLSATGGGSGDPIVFSVVSGPASTSGNILTVTGTGTVVVAANQAGNANYTAAPQVTQSVAVNQASQTINFTAPASPVTYGVAPITLSATAGGSGNPVVFSIVSGPGSINGTALTITGVGTVVVAANQAGNANYTAAPQVTQSVVVTSNSPPPVPNLVVTTALDDAGTASNCSPQSAPGKGTDASCSLRDALLYATNSVSTNISFDSTVFSVNNTLAQNSITLSNGGLNIPSNTRIIGSGSGLASPVTVSGANSYTVFTVGAGATGGSLTGLTIANGNSPSGGGAINNQGALAVSSCTLSGNNTTGNGGGVTNSGTLMLTDSTLSGNNAGGSGGAIWNQGALTVSSSTISANNASASAGGIENSGGTVNLANTIVSGNTAQTAADFDGAAYIDNGGNQVSVSDIVLAPLANYGGLTQTLLPLPGSPAICAGTAANASGLSADQRGFTRSTTYGTTACVDAGAVETNYALSFTTQPPSTATAGVTLSPAPAVQLTESGSGVAAADSLVSISGSPVTLTGTTSVNLTSGLAAFGNLIVPSGTSSEVLTATLALNSSLSLSQMAASSSISLLSTQNITFTPVSSLVTYGVAPITLLATGGASGNPVVFSVVSGPGSTSGNTLTITGIGTVVVAANQAGNTNYSAAPQVTQSITVNPASQAISFTPPLSPVLNGVAPITLSATGGGSGNPVVFSVLSGPGTISGNTLTITGIGTVVVAVNQTGNANYTAAPQVTQSVVVNQASQTINFTAPASPVTYGVAPITLSATGGGSGNPVVFSVLSGPGTISGNTLTITGIGTVVVAVNQTGNANYTAAPQVTQSVVVNQASQTITFTAPASPVTYGAAPITLSATGGASGNPVVFSVVSGPGSTSGNTLTITGAGTVVVAANQTSNANYTAAPQVTRSIVVNQASQTITFTAPASPVTYGVAPITLLATGGGSGNPIVFSVLSGPGTISGNTLNITGIGTVVVAVNQAGNANYSAATQVTQSVLVNSTSLQPVFTLVQKCHPKSNTTNTCTFANAVTPGDLVIGAAVIDNTVASTGVKDGAGNVFTLSPHSPCTGGSVTSHAWLFYLLSSPGGVKTNTVVFSDTNADYVDEVWAYEFSVSGGTPAFDTDTNGCGATTTNTNPVATLTLAGANELAYFASYVGGQAKGVGSPWTVGTATTLGDVDGYDTNASSSITTSITPTGQGWGIVMAMAFKVVPH
ncbi:choice-of-anchor Q domain-containing protein [Tunturiibacter lichenicola]|uniref:choice-of-anchor Q domain-containing protein n=1 Tax=Tunturiibacter lichenicola TaxID=2051959 RepID=UPI003D9BCFE3